MKDRPEINATVGDTKFGSSLKDLEEGDLSRGYYGAAPEGNYEASLDTDVFSIGGRGTRHAGHIEPDGYRETHGLMDEYGFVRRPNHGGDVERN